MRYSIEPKERIYIKGYGFLSFAKNMGKNLSNKYSQELLDTAKKSSAGSDIRFKTTMLRSNLCNYPDSYILVKGTITITGAAADAAAR